MTSQEGGTRNAAVTQYDANPARNADETQYDSGVSATEVTHLLHRLPQVLEERYEAVEDLGGGGQGFVLKCLPREGGEPVAIKVYSGSLPVPSDELITQLQACDRDHVTPILEFGRAGAIAWEIQEYFPLGTLANRLTGRPWPHAEVRRVLTELHAALLHIHEWPIVHRDLKPQNIFVRGEDPLDCVLGDFGLAKQLTMSVEIGSVAGAMAYMPPEAALAGKTSEESDWWALGVIIHQLLTGKHLFSSPAGQQVLLDQRFIKAALFEGHYDTNVPDERWALLVQGLLTYEQGQRWGGKQVTEWLAGGSPEVYSGKAKARTAPTRPLPFLGEPCANPAAVAAVIRRRYEQAEDYLSGSVRSELMAWLMSADPTDATIDLLGSSAAWKSQQDRAMVSLQLHLDPDVAPCYRGRELTSAGLQRVIREATGRDQAAAEWIASLRSDRILSLVDRLASDPAGFGAADENLRMWWVEVERKVRTFGTDERQVWEGSRGIAEGLALSAALAAASQASVLSQGANSRGDASSLSSALAAATSAASTEMPAALLAVTVIPGWREQRDARERAAQEREKARQKAEQEAAAQRAAEAARNRRRLAFTNARERVGARIWLNLVPATVTGLIAHFVNKVPVPEAALWSVGTLAGVVTSLFLIDLVFREPARRGAWAIGWLVFFWFAIPIVTGAIGATAEAGVLMMPSASVWYSLPIPLVVGYGVGSGLSWSFGRMSHQSGGRLSGQGLVSLLAGIPLVTLPAIRLDPTVLAALGQVIPSWYSEFTWKVYQYLPSMPLTTTQQLALIAISSALAVYWLLTPDRLLAIPRVPRWLTVSLLIVLWLVVAVTCYGWFTFGLVFFTVPVIIIHRVTRM